MSSARKTLRYALIGAAAAVIVLLISALGYQFASSLKYPEPVRVEGRYLQLACEFCPHIEVEAIEPEDHESLVGEMVYPQSDALDVHEFMASSLLAGQGRQFCLEGQLHRFTGWWPLRPAARPFTVQSIVIGTCANGLSSQ